MTKPRTLFRAILLLSMLFAAACGDGAPEPEAAARYEPTWESLQQYQAPKWFEDAKFGIFIHWGVYAVPGYGSEKYPPLMYKEGGKAPKHFEITQNVYDYHREHYGPQSEFGYKDFVPMFKAEKWDPDQWADLFAQAGAKYVVPVADHHDGFAMYDSSQTRWDAVEMGPRRDIAGELKAAVEKRGLTFGLSSHFANNRNYYTLREDFDTADPAYRDLYGDMKTWDDPASPEFLDRWYARTVDIIDKYHPAVLWFDYGICAPEFEPSLQKLAAYYYNRSAEWGVEPVLQYKDMRTGSFPEGTGVLDIERGKLDDIRPMVWQTDTSVSTRSWGYIHDDRFKSPDSLVDDLADIVSKNGCLLLNIGPRADGTIPEEVQEILRQIGDWLQVNGEAIYGTRPWKIYGEGPTKVQEGHHSEARNTGFTGEDIRFTTKAETLYAISLAWPGEKMTVKSLSSNSPYETRQISSVHLLGVDQELKWSQGPNGLIVEMPNTRPAEFAYALRIQF